MKRAFLLILGILCIGSLYLALTIPKKITNNLTVLIQNTGYPDAKITGYKIKPHGLFIPAVTLDQDGFDTAKSVTVKFNWFQNTLSQNIDSIHIKELTYNSLVNRIDLLKLYNRLNLDQVSSLPVKTLSIDRVQYNLSTDFGDVRIEAKLLLKELDNGDLSWQSVFWARQYQLGFEIPVSGVMKQDRSFLFESTFHDGKFNIGPLRISRLNGWASAKGKDGDLTNLALELDAGSGKLLNLPLQDLSFVLNKSGKSSNTLLRSNVSGIKSAHISFDALKKKKTEKASFTMEIDNEEDLKQFLDIIKPDSDENLFQTLKAPLLLTVLYLPERRFAGGPIPFEVALSSKDKTMLSGHILIYPVTLDVRGTLQGDKSLIKDVKTVLDIEDAGSSDESIPLDINLKQTLKNALKSEKS